MPLLRSVMIPAEQEPVMAEAGRSTEKIKPMPISLDDPEWESLTTSYGSSCDELIAWLRQAQATGMTSELLGNIINEVQHQGDTSDAMYAVAPHFLSLATDTKAPLARDMVIHAGLIHASSQSPTSTPCPPELKAEFQATAQTGKEQVLQLLSSPSEFDDFKYLIAALAGFTGHGRFGTIIEGFDFFEDEFHHTSLDEPFPED